MRGTASVRGLFSSGIAGFGGSLFDLLRFEEVLLGFRGTASVGSWKSSRGYSISDVGICLETRYCLSVVGNGQIVAPITSEFTYYFYALVATLENVSAIGKNWQTNFDVPRLNGRHFVSFECVSWNRRGR